MTDAIAHIAHIAPGAAQQHLEQRSSSLLIDVRSEMEFLMIGHPVGAVNVPWIDAPQWTVSPTFLADIRKLLLGRSSRLDGQRATVLLLCRSGNRSLAAAELLRDNGVVDVLVIEGGFEGELNAQHRRSSVNGWRHANMPWEQC